MFVTPFGAPVRESPVNHERHRPLSAELSGREHTAAAGAMAQAFVRHGGVVSAEEVALLLRRHHAQPVSQLARWIVGSKIVHFAEHSHTWVPLFQFHLDDMSIRPVIGQLLGELSPVLESEELAAWFVTPNAWLSNALPIEAVEADTVAVLDAARADRFVTAG